MNTTIKPTEVFPKIGNVPVLHNIYNKNNIMKAYIYKKTLKQTGKHYIGQHKGNDPNYYGSGVDWKKDLMLFNVDYNKDIITEILEYVDDISKLDEREAYWLEYYDVVNSKLFYNKTNKPFGPITHSIDTRQILSQKNTGKKREGEALENLRKGHQKRILNIDGKKISESKTNHECYKNPERGRKIGISNTGKKQSLETCMKRSNSLKGKSTKPKKQIQELNLEKQLIKIWSSVTELLNYWKENNIKYDYATFLKKQKENKPYKDKYWI
jgi:hypothetical protein